MKKLTLLLAMWLLSIAGGLQAQTYHEDDKAALRAFLRQPSAEAGKLNLEQLGLTLTDTTNWQTNEDWVGKVEGIEWNNNNPKRLTSINYWNKTLAGNIDFTACTALTDLGCANNRFTALDVSKNTALTYLNCSMNKLTALDVSKNTALTYLSCYNNQLTTLDVNKNIALNILDCDNNQLTALYVGGATALTGLHCSNNQLTALDVSRNTALTLLVCDNNRLSLSDLHTASQKISDEYKRLGTQHLVFFTDTTLDVNGVLDFYSQKAFGNPAANTVFMVKKGSNDAIENTDYSINNGIITFKKQGIYTVEMTNDSIIDNSSYPAKAVTGIILVDTSFNLPLAATLVTKASNLQIGVSATSGVVQIDWGNGNITNWVVNTNTLTPISHATEDTTIKIYGNDIISLSCDDNPLTALDVSGAIALIELNCSFNQLTTLDITQNTALAYLSCSNNQLTALDVSKNTALTELDCSFNQLTAFDVTQNTALTKLSCHYNQLTTLDVSKNTALNILRCISNQLMALDISKNTALADLHCYDNRLSLSNLYAISQKISNDDKYLGSQQPVFFKDTALAVNGVLDFSSQKAFGNPAANTVFVVKKGNNNAIENTDYSINNGIITFKKQGIYTVEMTNDSIISDSSYPAKATTGNIKVGELIYTISASVNGGNGSISPIGDSLVKHGNSITYTIIPNTGYIIDQALIDGENNSQAVTDGNYTFSNVQEDHSIVVSFKATTGIAEVQDSESSLKVYPNPVASQLRIKNYELGIKTISIYDMQGKLVAVYSLPFGKIDGLIDISHLPTGTYFMKVGNETVKVIKN